MPDEPRYQNRLVFQSQVHSMLSFLTVGLLMIGCRANNTITGASPEMQ
jgi:hypothetical protein